MKLTFKTLSLVLAALTLFTGCAAQKLSQDNERLKKLGPEGDTQTRTNKDAKNLNEISPSPSSSVSPSPSQTPCSPVRLNVPNNIYPPVPSLPQSLPEPLCHSPGKVNLDDESLAKLLDYEANVAVGVGHLRPKDLSPYRLDITTGRVGGGWASQVVLPLYKQPGGQYWGWLAGGWLLRPSGKATDTFVPDSRSIRMVNIGYICSVCSALVLEIREDGWFKFRYAEATPDDDGTAWAHQAHLELGEVPLIVETWEKWLPKNSLNAFFFVNEGPYALRKEPTDESEPVTWLRGKNRPLPKDKIPDFNSFAPQVIQGDWMRVQIRSDCTSPTEATNEPQCQEGWIRWRNAEQGSLVWYTDW